MPGAVTVVGSINTDLVVRVSRFAAPGETVVGQSFATYGGGKGANQAIAAARLGATVRMVGALGSDSYSKERRAALGQEAVDDRWVMTEEDQPGGVALIQVDDHGENLIIIVPGANAAVTPQDVTQALAGQIRSADVIGCQLELPIESVEAALAAGTRVGARTVLNAAPFIAEAKHLLTGVHTLIVNEIEAGQLLNSRPVIVDDAHAAAWALATQGPAVVIITLGRAGAYVHGPELDTLVPAQTVDVVDTTGAGDAFAGAYLAWMAKGQPLHEAAAAAVHAGTLAVQRHGAQSSLPTQQELDTFLAER